MNHRLAAGWPARAAFLLLALLLGPGCLLAPPEEANGVFRVGLEQAEAGDTEAAIKTLQDGVSQYPTHLRMRFELARLQFDSGELHHAKERAAMLRAAASEEKGSLDEAKAQRSEAGKHRARALPFYQAARENLLYVTDHEDDDAQLGWAFYLLSRTLIFFEDWVGAHDALDRAIEHGKPPSSKLARWREYQAGLREKFELAEDR